LEGVSFFFGRLNTQRRFVKGAMVGEKRSKLLPEKK
jgi:hypothetical protein